jgi:hypothetical protein
MAPPIATQVNAIGTDLPRKRHVPVDPEKCVVPSRRGAEPLGQCANHRPLPLFVPNLDAKCPPRQRLSYIGYHSQEVAIRVARIGDDKDTRSRLIHAETPKCS